MLLFIEFVAVFEPLVWVSLFVTLSCFIIFLKLTWKTERLHLFINVIKLLLEQGDPFPPPFFRKSSCRIMFGTLGLSALVLSNGYKNDNVYRMITSRIPVTYDTLADLLQDGFKLYSRSGMMGVIFSYIEHPIKWKFSPK